MMTLKSQVSRLARNSSVFSLFIKVKRVSAEQRVADSGSCLTCYGDNDDVDSFHVIYFSLHHLHVCCTEGSDSCGSLFSLMSCYYFSVVVTFVLFL